MIIENNLNQSTLANVGSIEMPQQTMALYVTGLACNSCQCYTRGC